MYVKIRMDGALGIGRATEGSEEITIGYGEAHMIAAALEKLAQTARNYKQLYRKTTDVGGGHTIEFERDDDGRIVLAGDKQRYYCTESEIRHLAELLKRLPPVQVAPASDYVQKIPPQDKMCIVVKNGGNSATLKITEAALLKTAVLSSVDSRFYEEIISIDNRNIELKRTSDLKWQLVVDGKPINFTAYEVEALISGLHNGVLDVLMDVVKSMGSDDIADIRIKSRIQGIEQETARAVGEHPSGKEVVRNVVKMAKKILASNEDAEARTNEFIELCKYVYSRTSREITDAVLRVIATNFVVPP
ncbi:MAG: hypothetical protein QXS20_02750 [Candidatus Thorarchaeota archaeon]